MATAYNSVNETNVLVDPETGVRYPIGGCHISSTSSTLPSFSSQRILKNADLPPVVDLRPLMQPVEDQGYMNTR